MKRFFVLVLVALILSSSQEPNRVRFGSVIPKDSPWEEGINAYIKNAETKAGGKIKFKTYLGGQLGGEVEMIKSVAMGSLDAGAFTVAAVSEALSIPQLQVFEMPFLFNSDEEADYVMDQMFDVMSDVFAKKGLVLVMWGTNGWRSFGTKSKPVLSPADLKGLKMRSQESDVYINFYKTMGATPVPISTPDVLVALKTGMVDGYDQTPVFSLSTGWINTVKHFTLSKHIYQPGCIVLSKKYFEKLSPDVQEAILSKNERPALQKNSRELIRKDDAFILSTFPDMEIKVHNLTEAQRDAFKKASAPVYTTMEAKMGKSVLNVTNAHIRKFREGKK